MRTGFTSTHWTDAEGRNAGGTTYGAGFTIGWQRGQLGRDEHSGKPNGAFVEDIIDVALDRLRHYQSRFACIENAEAMMHLERALASLSKTKERETHHASGAR